MLYKIPLSVYNKFIENMKIWTTYIAIAVLVLIMTPGSSVFTQNSHRIIHVFVALCDNEHQGIVPVPPKLGDGNDPDNNLYWGAMYGVKTFFTRSQHWKLLSTTQPPPVPKRTWEKWLSRFYKPTNPVLERCVFQHTRENVFLVADAYKGSKIKQAIIDFLNAASGTSKEFVSIQRDAQTIDLNIHGSSQLVVYVGHDGLMDFQLRSYPERQDEQPRDAMILACISKHYFYEPLLKSGANPLLWTTGLMAPEAYTLESAIEGWIAQESPESIRLRAAKAYNSYQKCGLKAAKNLFATGQ
jgi:hypothetical protein